MSTTDSHLLIDGDYLDKVVSCSSMTMHVPGIMTSVVTTGTLVTLLKLSQPPWEDRSRAASLRQSCSTMVGTEANERLFAEELLLG